MKKLLFALIAGTISLVSCSNLTTNNSSDYSKVKIKTGMDSLCYAYGLSLGNYIKTEVQEEFSAEAFAKAIYELYNNEESLMTQEEANIFINTKMKELQQLASIKNLEEGKAFLKENEEKEGVTVLASGVQYEVIKQGDGPLPLATDKVKTHYKGTLIDGTVFDSSLDRGPAEFVVNRVIPGWTEVLQLMPVGSKWKVYIPSDKAYGSRPMPGGKIKPNSTLIFEIELLDIVPDETSK